MTFVSEVFVQYWKALCKHFGWLWNLSSFVRKYDMIGNQGVNVITNHSIQLGIIVLSFAFYFTGITKG